MRVDKDSPVIETLGAIDELNSSIGFMISMANAPGVRDALLLVQHDLFDLGAQISVPGTPLLSQPHLERLERSIETMDAGLGPLEASILPGGAPSSALSHVARTVCRRAEQCLTRLSEIDRQAQLSYIGRNSADRNGLAYLNRLSDLLFVIARAENAAASRADVIWENGKSITETEGM
ncbi:cob(I)yrinic acid a,c-diamide adenosyltransferase [Tianweitania populi]|uniref:cob(I)yrinic acid a,c-diamide adenosyltransferase n=1 Tax=Tianweitania populi TaxID=1607949 RepID=UPI001FCE89D7|nr:cob(I)yrinic acid a,c-diamide adenosyltransferase [Tianweitania populi]